MNKDDIVHLASLSRLELTDAEIEAFPDQLDAILGFVDQIKDANIGDDVVRDMQNHNSFREDDFASVAGESREEIMNAFPNRTGDHLVVSKVLPN